MRLATVRRNGGTSAVRIDADHAVLLPFPTLRELLESGADWRERVAETDGEVLDIQSLDYAPVIPNPEKTICVGLNYRAHAMEAGHKIPSYPVLFAKFSRSLIGANDPIVLPDNSEQVDWEVELGIVIGREIRNAKPEQVREAIAGYTIVNDISMRDWQFHTPQYLPGKTFEGSTPVGPHLVTLDDVGSPDSLDLSCDVDGASMQSSNTKDLIFSVTEIVCYISSFITLVPGDLIATGTPSGVGVARKPPVFLKPGNEVSCAVEGLGRQRNACLSAASQAGDYPVGSK